MTRYCMDLILKEWVNPFIDTSKWEYFDCSCKNRDATDDQVGGSTGGGLWTLLDGLWTGQDPQ